MQQAANKKTKGQFYTENHAYILDGFTIPDDVEQIIEPFAGKGDLIDWTKVKNFTGQIEQYDIEPKAEGIETRDTLLDPPNYQDKWILTNPPYLARNKCESKEIFDKYDTNDLYKCFIWSLCNQEKKCQGGIFIIPVGFFLSPRDIDTRCRNTFLSKYRITRLKYFEEDVFKDTTTTVVVFSFEASDVDLTEQTIEWIKMPTNERKTFTLSAANNWIIGGDIYKIPISKTIKIHRHIVGKEMCEGEQLTDLTLSAVDSGSQEGRIALEFKKGYIYPSVNTSRAYATICISGKTLSDEEQKKLSKDFKDFLEQKRTETWSLFLPQFRESKEYARKRIPFDLAYQIILHLLIREPV
jgi:hypothetical protein